MGIFEKLKNWLKGLFKSKPKETADKVKETSEDKKGILPVFNRLANRFATVFGLKRQSDGLIIHEEVRASNFIAPHAYDDESGLFLCPQDKMLAVCFECSTLVGGDEKTMEHLSQVVSQNFPEGTAAQFFLYKSPDIMHHTAQMRALRGHVTDPFLRGQIEERIKYLQTHTKEPIIAKTTNTGATENLGTINDTKLIVSFKFPIASHEPTDKEVESIKVWVNKVHSLLAAVPLNPRKMNAQEYIRIMQTLINWGDNAVWKNEYRTSYDPKRLICDQIFDWEGGVMKADDRTLQLGDKIFCKTLSAKKFPDSMFFGDAINYIGDLTGGKEALQGNYAISVNIYFPDPLKKKQKMMSKRQFNVNQGFGPMVKFVPVLGDKIRSDNLFYESFQKGAIPFEMSYSLVLFAESQEKIEAMSAKAISNWKTQNFNMFEDRFIMAPMFRNVLPLGTDPAAIVELDRYKSMTSDKAPVILPIFSEWKGTGTYHMGMIARNGQIMSLSLHDTTTNKNCLITAQSGSGKSYLLNSMISSYLSEGAKVWVIDAGKSYKNLCEVYKGEFMQFDADSKINLNPFANMTDWEDDEDMIMSILSSMASPTEKLETVTERKVKKILNDLWEVHKEKTNIDMIAKACLEIEDGDRRVVDVGASLYPFTSKGAYGRYFRGDELSAISKADFTVLELDELQSKKDLRHVVLLQLINQIAFEIYRGERNRKKILVVDEAWDLLKEPTIAAFIEGAYRKFRKYGGSAIIATQDIGDLFNSESGRAINTNSATKILLGQSPDTIERIHRNGDLELSPGLWNLMKTVHTKPGVYSEMFVVTDSYKGVIRFTTSPFENLMFSTDPKDVHAIETYVNAGMPRIDAMNQVLLDRMN